MNQFLMGQSVAEQHGLKLLITSVPASPPVRPRHWAASQRTSAVPLLNIARTGRTLELYTRTLTCPPLIGREADS